MVKRMAVVDQITGDVERVILYDDELPPERQWPIPPGFMLVEDFPNTARGEAEPLRSRWDGTEFVVVEPFGEATGYPIRNVTARDTTPSDAVRHGRRPDQFRGTPA
jgi:hypothetical protein